MSTKQLLFFSHAYGKVGVDAQGHEIVMIIALVVVFCAVFQSESQFAGILLKTGYALGKWLLKY